ncbi:MAG TPA: RNA methyltransferase [Stellaceae bacterium]|nr:RNA methyltransferase [Stellaceae bacterium]
MKPQHERQLLRISGLAAVQALFERDPGRVERLFYVASVRGEVASFCRSLARVRKPYRQVEPAELARIAGTVLHGGVVAIARPRPLPDFDPEAAPEIAGAWGRDGKPLLILDGIGNPHNLGAIVRSAAFFGIERIFLADRPEQALPSDASYRVAEGGFEHLSLYRVALPGALGGLRGFYRIVGTALGQCPVPQKWHYPRPVALVLGNEETGLDPATLTACDEVVTIPGSGRMQSLNVAAAAAILMYLLTRR